MRYDKRPMGSIEVFGGEQEPAELTAMHAVLFGGWDLGPSNVPDGVGDGSAVAVRKAVIAAHGRQSPIDRRRSESALVHR